MAKARNPWTQPVSMVRPILISIVLTALAILSAHWVSVRISHGPTHQVRWYKDGKTTASGDSFDFKGISCAVKDRTAMGRWFRFYCEGNVVYAYANDLIPPTSPGEYELSWGAFKRLANPARGVIECRVKEAK